MKTKQEPKTGTKPIIRIQAVVAEVRLTKDSRGELFEIDCVFKKFGDVKRFTITTEFESALRLEIGSLVAIDISQFSK